MPIKNKPCHCCNGSGEEYDDASTGRMLRKLRLGAGISQRAMALSLDISPSMLVFLEKGKRHWTPQMITDYRRLCFDSKNLL